MFKIILLSPALLFLSCKEAKETANSTPPAQSLPKNPTEEKPEYPAFVAPEGASKGEALALNVEYFMEAYNKGNADLLVESTHSSNFTHSNMGMDNDAFKKKVKQGIQRIMKLGIKLDSLKASIPSKFYSDGVEEICFIPTTYILNLNDKKFDVQTFTLAAGSEKSGWKFIDGAGLSKNPDRIYKLFPNLEKNITLPPHKLTFIEPSKTK